MKYKYYPMHMHLHASCDYGASMALDMYNASKLGMEYIWFTDHDTRMGIRENCVDGFSFDTPSLMKYTDSYFYGFEILNENTDYKIDEIEKTLILKAQSEENGELNTSGIKFMSKGTLHTCSLSADVTLSVEVKDLQLQDDCSLIFAVKLSQRPPDMENAYMVYVLGDAKDFLSADNSHIQILPLKIEDGKAVLPLSEDVSTHPQIGGRDNAFDTLYIILHSKNNKESFVKIGDFKIERKWEYEDLKMRLQKSADEAGKIYKIKPFVSTEISGAGEHKNCYGTNVPVIDYKKYNFNISEEEAINHVKKYGGIFAINHPFAIKKLKKVKYENDKQADKVLNELFEELNLNNANGATLMEVGFPEGRNYPLKYYLRLWDMLSLSGVFLTGYGSSDCHRDNEGWFDKNNFATYIGVDSRLTFPVCENEFVSSLKNGTVYTADPVKIKGNVKFETSSGLQMGSVIFFEKENCTNAKFSMENAEKGWIFKHISNGETIYSDTISDKDFEYSFVIEKTEEKVSFHRMEIYDEKGRCILLTNPIYVINKECFNKLKHRKVNII